MKHLAGRYFLMFAMLLFSCGMAVARIPVGEWSVHPAYHNATKVEKAFGRIFVLSDGSLYSYDRTDDYIQTYDRLNFLSDTEISDMAFCQKENALLLCYRNGNIDFLLQDDEVYNVTDILFSRLLDKQINELRIYGSKAYISTNSGIVILDIRKREISDTYRFSSPVTSTLLYNNLLVCITGNGVYCGNVEDNLMDKTAWKKIEERTIFTKLFEYDNRIVISVIDNSIFYIDPFTSKLQMIDKGFRNIFEYDGSLYVDKKDCLCIYKNGNIPERMSCPCPVAHILYDNNTIWIAGNDKGLAEGYSNGNSITIRKSGIIPDSPQRNFFNFMHIDNDGTLLVAGGSLNYSGIDYQGTLMEYKNGNWFNFPEEGIAESTRLKYINLTSVVRDPENAGHFYAGSARHGLYEYKDYVFEKHYSFDNSALETILPSNPLPHEYVSVDGLKYDENGNLWMLNNEVDTIFRILKPDGHWAGLYYKDIAGLPTFKKILFGKGNLVWTVSTRYRPGVFCIDTKGTIFNNKDDIYRFSGQNFTNQDGISVTVNDIFDFEQDREGTMWLCTDQGIFIIPDAESFISSNNLTFNRIKISRNDGSGQADYLLNGVYTTAICIDEGNRKWIGTLNNGLFLLSEDGTETIHHFTKDNSPLISDNISNIKIDGNTGEVYIATDKGLCVFGGDAVRPETKLEKSKISIFPNPFNVSTDEYLTITGLTDKSYVKIVNSSGRLVYAGFSEGGSFTWNIGGSTEKVSSGNYYAMIQSKEGGKGVSVSFTIIL